MRFGPNCSPTDLRHLKLQYHIVSHYDEKNGYLKSICLMTRVDHLATKMKTCSAFTYALRCGLNWCTSDLRHLELQYHIVSYYDETKAYLISICLTTRVGHLAEKMKTCITLTYAFSCGPNCSRSDLRQLELQYPIVSYYETKGYLKSLCLTTRASHLAKKMKTCITLTYALSCGPNCSCSDLRQLELQYPIVSYYDETKGYLKSFCLTTRASHLAKKMKTCIIWE